MDGLEIDGYNEKVGLGFEYQGIHHAQRVPHFQREEKDFKAQQERDALKQVLFDKNNRELLTVPHTVPFIGIRAYVRNFVSELFTQFNPEQKLCSDIEFYNKIRVAGVHIMKQDAKIKEVIKNKGGEALSDYVGYKVPMLIRCAKGHEFKATPEAISQPARRGVRFCTECNPTRKKGDDEIKAIVNAKGWDFIKVESKMHANKMRRMVTLKCQAHNHEHEYSCVTDTLKKKLSRCSKRLQNIKVK
jgi:hypothetical protein